VIPATGERIPPKAHLQGWYPGHRPSRFFLPGIWFTDVACTTVLRAGWTKNSGNTSMLHRLF
jgi:hypothetical protein